MPPALSTDTKYIMNNCNGYVALIVDDDHDTDVPSDLMHGGHHFDDVPRNILANYKFGLSQCQEMLPREALHNFIASGYWARPTLNKRK